MTPPYSITPEILRLVESITLKLGEINARYLSKPAPQLRKENRIRTIHASLGIEGNSLRLDQITALLNGKKVIGPQRDILEVRNAIAACEQLESFNPFSSKSFLTAHGILMRNLVSDAGKWRRASVGIVHGNKVAHIAPPASNVQGLMRELFDYTRKAPDSMLIKSCVFHYEMEFIHPFMDGNGRMGRLWQTLLLSKHHPIFASLPFETIIRDTQQDYYNALAASDKLGQSTPFIFYMLGVIDESLNGFTKSSASVLKESDRVHYFLSMKSQVLDASARAETTASFTRKDYLQVFKTLSTATASRDLNAAVKSGVLKRMGEGNQARYGGSLDINDKQIEKAIDDKRKRRSTSNR
jgi:Fic family protein